MLTVGASSGADLNFDALVRPMSRGTVRERSRISAPERDAGDSAAWASLLFRLTVVAVLLVGIVAVVLLLGAVLIEDPDARQSQSLIPMVAGASLLVAALLFLAVFIIRAALRQDVPRLGGRARRTRLLSFVAANPPMTLTHEILGPTYPGIPFRSTIRPVLFDVVRTQFQLPVEIGNLRHMGTARNAQAAVVRGYLRIPLGRTLPNMLLLSRKDQDNTAIPVEVRGDQTLSLEGDFDRNFTLYVPREYERDALYLFTPDLMALLIDEAKQFDVEIVDSWLHIYSHQPFRMVDPATYLLASRLVALLGAKATRQTARYADDRVPHPSTGGPSGLGEVAPRGRRLQTAAPLTVILTAVAAAGGVLVSFFLTR